MWYSYLETRAKFRGVSKQLPSSNLMAFMFVHVSPVKICSALRLELISFLPFWPQQHNLRTSFVWRSELLWVSSFFRWVLWPPSKRHSCEICQILGAARIASLSLMFLFPQYLSVRFFQALQIVVEICTFDNLIAIAVICCLLERPHLSIN